MTQPRPPFDDAFRSDAPLTPRQAAAIVGASESSVRRWCDQERLANERTPGGHRRIRLSSLLAFARASGMPISITAAHGARGEGGKQASAVQLSARVYECAISGDELGLRRVLADSVSAGRSLAYVCDHLLAPALHRLGREWCQGRATIYQEHRATEAIGDALVSCKALVATPGARDPLALCCALSGDVYALAPRMSALVLREAGYRTALLGPDTPVDSVRQAIVDLRPALVALSASCALSNRKLVDAIGILKEHASAHGAALAVGGRALTGRVRRAVCADFFGDSMTHLRGFATGLYQRRERRVTGDLP